MANVRAWSHGSELLVSRTSTFITTMPFTMILTLYVIPCKFSCDYSKLTIIVYTCT